ncbi:MAG: hypothetical protein ACYDCL_00110 [Myxococcales bacterium]
MILRAGQSFFEDGKGAVIDRASETLESCRVVRSERKTLLVAHLRLDSTPIHRCWVAPGLAGSKGAFTRMVRRNGRAVRAALVSGKVAVEGGAPLPALGRGFGRVLRAVS